VAVAGEEVAAVEAEGGMAAEARGAAASTAGRKGRGKGKDARNATAARPADGPPWIVAKILQPPWDSDVANGDKRFECVRNKPGRRCGQLTNLRANDFFVILGAETSCTAMAVGRIGGPPENDVRNKSVLYDALMPVRKRALDQYLKDAPTFNYVLFDQVYDLRPLRIKVADLAVRIKMPVKAWHFQGLVHLSVNDREAPEALARFLDANCRAHTFPRVPAVPATMGGDAVTVMARAEGPAEAVAGEDAAEEASGT